jgi:DNA-binding transcriptional regulator YiaG
VGTTGIETLLERVRSRRQLPPAAERRRIREQANVSLRDMGAALGVSHSLVRYWEQGGTPREHRAAYAELLERLKGVSAG